MKKILLSTVALIGLTVTAAAADLPSRKAPAMMAPVPVFTWTGFYAGVNAGYGWGNDDNRGFAVVNRGGNDGGFVGGAQLGYNYQMGMFVLGAETDLQYADLGNNFTSNGVRYGSDNEFFGTTRVRAGVAFDRFMVYATGGVAYGDSNFGWTAGGGVEYAFTDNLTAKIEGLYVNIDGDNRDFLDLNLGNGNTEFGVVRAGLNYKFSSY
jgi:outer membrane immunogenic protein